MTTLAYKHGVLASDSSCFERSCNVFRTPKIFKLQTGTLVGFAGSVTEGIQFVEWVKNGRDARDYPKMKDLEAIVVLPDGTILTYDQESPIAVPCLSDYCAAGGGYQIALGVMWRDGGTAEEAILAAIDHHGSTKGPVQTVRLDS